MTGEFTGDGRVFHVGIEVQLRRRSHKAFTWPLYWAAVRLRVRGLVWFVVIEARSPAPLLPLRIFRVRTLSAANATMLAVGATAFAQFFLLTLYLQQVLGYSAIATGVAFVAITATIVVCSSIGQALTTRLGARPVLSAGLLLTAAGVALYQP